MSPFLGLTLLALSSVSAQVLPEPKCGMSPISIETCDLELGVSVPVNTLTCSFHVKSVGGIPRADGTSPLLELETGRKVRDSTEIYASFAATAKNPKNLTDGVLTEFLPTTKILLELASLELSDNSPVNNALWIKQDMENGDMPVRLSAEYRCIDGNPVPVLMPPAGTDFYAVAPLKAGAVLLILTPDQAQSNFAIDHDIERIDVQIVFPN